MQLRPFKVALWTGLLLAGLGTAGSTARASSSARQGPAAASSPARPGPAAVGDALDTRLVLIGDGGNPDVAGEPVLKALIAELSHDPSRTLAVFLGDNIYPFGLPRPTAPDRAEMERRLDAQVDAARAAGVRAIFVPGNHDWDQEGVDGWNAIRREAARITERGAPLIEMQPGGGCPGPEVIDVSPLVRLVVLDTQWWLQEGPRPLHPTSSCANDSEDEVIGALKTALADTEGRQVVVVGHHPLATGGPHGGKFSWRQHFFPLSEIKRGILIPLPLIGSLYPLARKNGVSDQDLAGRRNKAMRQALESAFERQPPLVYASGHEHALQVIRRSSGPALLVSGSGFFDHGSAVYAVPGTTYRSSLAGFMRLDLDPHGGARVAVITVDKAGRGTTAHVETLR